MAMTKRERRAGPHYIRLPTAGHFAGWEQPDFFVQQMRTAFKSLRSDEAKTGSSEHN